MLAARPCTEGHGPPGGGRFWRYLTTETIRWLRWPISSASPVGRSTELVTVVPPAGIALPMSLCPALRGLIFDLTQKFGHDRGSKSDNQHIDPNKKQTARDENRDSQDQTLALGPGDGFA
jgi:hypothetical protein